MAFFLAFFCGVMENWEEIHRIHGGSTESRLWRHGRDFLVLECDWAGRVVDENIEVEVHVVPDL